MFLNVTRSQLAYGLMFLKSAQVLHENMTNMSDISDINDTVGVESSETERYV